MEQSMFILLLGVVLGCVVASGIWAVLWTLIKGDKRLQKDRIDIMRNIAVLCAEIDDTIARRAGGGTVFPDFQPSLPPLLEKIHRNLTISMPLLDVYYVKYIESLIARYEQAATQVPGAEKAPTVTEKTFSVTVGGKDSVVRQAHEVRIEESGATAAGASNFEVTQPYEPAKEKPGPEALDKKPSDVKRPLEETAAVRIAEINKEPVAPVAAKVEKPIADFSGEKAPRIKRKSNDGLKSKIGVIADAKPAALETPTEDTGEVDIEDVIKTQKIDLKEEIEKTVQQAHEDEHFISGEDVIDKLDSFFGIDHK